MSKFYADRFYKDERGNYYTGEYLNNQYKYNHAQAENNGFILVDYKAPNTWDAFHQEMQGKTVRCNYSQIFNPDSALILANNVPQVFEMMWEHIENGSDYDEESDTYAEIYQYFIIDDNTAERLKEHTNEIIFYWPEMDVYILGVTHWGTAWDHVSAEFIY